jgi:hypothetical protein
MEISDAKKVLQDESYERRTSHEKEPAPKKRPDQRVMKFLPLRSIHCRTPGPRALVPQLAAASRARRTWQSNSQKGRNFEPGVLVRPAAMRMAGANGDYPGYSNRRG